MSVITIHPTGTLRFGQILAFWFPLFLTWLFMALEGPFLTGIIARVEDPKFNLAAFGISLSLLLICESPVLMLISASIALIRDRASFEKLRSFSIRLSAAMSVVLVLVATDPIFSWIALDLMDLDARVASLAQVSLWILAPCPFAVGYRRFYQGFLVRSNRTRLVALGTVVRLMGMMLGGLAMYLHGGVPGAYIGAAGLGIGMIVEAFACRLMAVPEVRKLQQSSHTHGEPLDSRAISRFYFPLAMTTMLSLSVQPMVSFFVAHGRMPLESLAVLPVIQSLVLMFRSFGLSYQEAVVALTGTSKQRLRSVTLFAGIVAFGSTGMLALITFTPLRDLWFGKVAGLSPALSEFAIVPAQIMTLMPALTAYMAWQRGLLASRKQTSPITIAALIEVLVISSALVLGIDYFGFVGAIAACLAVVLGEICGFAIVLWWIRRLSRTWAWEAETQP